MPVFSYSTPDFSKSKPCVLGALPTATRTFSAFISDIFLSLSSKVTIVWPFSFMNFTAFLPVNIFIPSFLITFANTSPASKSSLNKILSSISTIDTSTPSRLNACDNSTPIGPPPNTIIDFGNVFKSNTVSLVKKSTSFSPGIGKTTG